MLSGVAGQEGGDSSGPAELVQLRKAWLQERSVAGSKVDAEYLESLEIMKGRLAKKENAKAVEALDKEILARLAVMATREGRLPETKSAKGQIRPKEVLTEGQQKSLKEKLEGVVWRVDQAGDGLRWYYFEAGGKVAWKSHRTGWIWTELDGEWKVEPQGFVKVIWPDSTIQIFQSSKGEPKISMNNEGTLSIRPFRHTALKYPGEGKE